MKPPHLVAKRNARERRRVHAVNLAFLKLRRAVPFENKASATSIFSLLLLHYPRLVRYK